MTDAGQRFLISADTSGVRVDLFISQHQEGLSRSFVRRLIEEGHVLVNGEAVKASRKVKVGDVVQVDLPPPQPSPVLVPEDMPLDIIYEDADILVVNKPAGLTVYPAPGHPHHTLMNAILAHCPQLASIESSVRPGVVHRLDKDTSGVMVVAKNKAAQLYLSSQMKGHRVLKRYVVLVKGLPSPAQGAIEAPIGRHPRDRKRMAVIEGGRPSRTLYRVTRRFKGYSEVEATLETGRTHQIRVHFSHKGWPVVGDTVYGVRVPWLGRQFVHARTLGLRLPGSGKYVEFSAELPADLQAALETVSSVQAAPS
ncbi:MAG: RluA family pseudouridine synthase [Dehalococcoidia bacterium]|nr:RluA family pseudouridine synthase [Dehalococcoidia bacterium]